MPYMYDIAMITPYTCALYVCLICMPYTPNIRRIFMPNYALHVCLIRMPYIHALYVCLICTTGMYALHVCLTCMQAAEHAKRAAIVKKRMLSQDASKEAVVQREVYI